MGQRGGPRRAGDRNRKIEALYELAAAAPPSVKGITEIGEYSRMLPEAAGGSRHLLRCSRRQRRRPRTMRRLGQGLVRALTPDPTVVSPTPMSSTTQRCQGEFTQPGAALQRDHHRRRRLLSWSNAKSGGRQCDHPDDLPVELSLGRLDDSHGTRGYQDHQQPHRPRYVRLRRQGVRLRAGT